MQYKILMTAIAARLRQQQAQALTLAALADALAAGAAAVSQYGGAHAGSRTMLDALLPAVQASARWASLRQDCSAVLC
jgi:hypothetical protein